MRVVILCGGSGSRLWPESRESLPKQFISIFDDKSLLELTIERFINSKIKLKPIVICNKKHGFLVRKSLDKYKLKADILLEPEGKNTCAAIYLAAKHCSINDNLLIMPSDHLISDYKKFMKDIFKIEQCLPLDYWITLGVKPTRPSDAYGYIKVSKHNLNNFSKVMKFIEKPSKKVACDLITEPNYYWNSGIFIANASMVLKSIKNYAPIIAKYCDKAFDTIKKTESTNEFNFSASSFTKIPSQSIDYAVMEHEKNIYLSPFNSDWSDVGSWDAIAEINQYKNINNNVVQVNSSNNFIRSKNSIIGTIGIKDLIIIESDNAILVSKKNETENVKLLVDKLLKKDIVQAKEHSFENRPWGKFENLLDNKYCKVKKITVEPKKRLSLQYHNFRSEHWLVVNGTANVFVDGKRIVLFPGNSIDIPIKSHHYIENKQNENLIIIETQLGTYFGEDDIVRLDDPHER